MLIKVNYLFKSCSITLYTNGHEGMPTFLGTIKDSTFAINHGSINFDYLNSEKSYGPGTAYD